ncbi:MAG TPA: L,D-transpeptidase family protein [Dehalococcoidia bacterium]|jgi:lipoprotein-anchoring transpeptidase ErfK/SrfK|nr:L,D-transpeptidase family protein [Dehalococcoidia bacterium]
MKRRPALALLSLAAALVAVSCALAGMAEPTPEPTESPAPPPTVELLTAAPPSPTPGGARPLLSPGTTIVVGGPVNIRAEPTTASPIIGTLQDLQPVAVAGVVQGENWIIGSQTWPSAQPSWARDWAVLESGGYVYVAFLFTAGPGETSPFIDPGGAERWIDIDLSEQRARAMVGDAPVYEARITSGAPPFESPRGTHAIEPDGRIALERMTASQAGYSPEQARYDVERVLFTQYFDRNGNALHLNYWRPESVFGTTPTSHGCIGLLLHDAQWFWLFGEPGMRVEIHD